MKKEKITGLLAMLSCIIILFLGSSFGSSILFAEPGGGCSGIPCPIDTDPETGEKTYWRTLIISGQPSQCCKDETDENHSGRQWEDDPTI